MKSFKMPVGRRIICPEGLDMRVFYKNSVIVLLDTIPEVMALIICVDTLFLSFCLQSKSLLSEEI